MATPYGLLVAGFDYSNAAEDEFNDWYDTEHIPERMRVKGFINAQRWVGADDPRIAVATYDLASVAVLDDAVYIASKGDQRTPWSKRMGEKAQLFCRVVAAQIVPGTQPGPDGAGGLLMVAMNVKAEAETDFNAWYGEEHLPALLAVPGCLCARRFKATEGAHQYVALYHLTGPEVAASEAWQTAVNTPWTAKTRPHTSDRLRLVLRAYRRQSPLISQQPSIARP